MCGHWLIVPDPALTSLTPPQRVVVLAIRAWHRRYGRTPRIVEWTRRGTDHPSHAQVVRLFGSWKAGIRAAGFEPPAQGRKLLRLV